MAPVGPHHRAPRLAPGCRHPSHAAGRPTSVCPLSSLSGFPEYSEEELFHYTSGRWLVNEYQYLADLNVTFNVQALLRVAASVLGAPCSSITKLAEGGSNKIYLLTFQNGTEAVARLPHSSVCQPHLVIASEVATMTYLREKFQLPIPKVYAWSSDISANEVGAEYIIMERLPGTTLDPSCSRRRLDPGIYETVLNMHGDLSSVHFSQIGSLFFKEDVSAELQARRLYASGVPDDQWSNQYRIGPCMNEAFRRDVDVLGEAECGPWSSIESYLQAIIRSEQRSITSKPLAHEYERPIPDYHPSTHLEDLDRLSALVPYMLPPAESRAFCLWHPDLNASNVLITASEPVEVTGVLDWQSAMITPIWWQVGVPPCFKYSGSIIEVFDTGEEPRLPDDATLNEALQDDQDKVVRHLERALRHTMYMRLSTTFPALHEVLRHDLRERLPNPLCIASAQRWANRSQCQQYIITLYMYWDDSFAGLAGYPEKFPLNHDAEEMRASLYQVYDWLGCQTLQDRIEEKLNIGVDGYVSSERYEEVRQAAKSLKEKMLAEAAEDDERNKILRWWPYPDL